VSSLRIAAFAMRELYGQLAKDGTTAPQLQRMQTRKELYELIGYHDYEALDAGIVKSLVPITPER
jgi:methylisocitrate lyase